MMRHPIYLLAVCGWGALGGACTDTGVLIGTRPIETGFSFTNLSRHAYAQLDIRAHDPNGGDGPFHATQLLPPGATIRERFLDTLGQRCPGAVDLRLILFERANSSIPIGLDDGEAVNPIPTAAGEIADVPACTSVVVETYTIVNWDAPLGIGRVKIAQATPLETVIRSADLFPNPDAAWEFEGMAPGLESIAPRPHVEARGLSGRVIDVDGLGVEGVGVLIRSRFRIRLTDLDETNDPDVGFSEPIDFATTDEDGSFRFDRPAGAYRVEVFSDEFLFRPAIVDLESPADTVVFIAEPIS